MCVPAIQIANDNVSSVPSAMLLYNVWPCQWLFIIVLWLGGRVMLQPTFPDIDTAIVSKLWEAIVWWNCHACPVSPITCLRPHTPTPPVYGRLCPKWPVPYSVTTYGRDTIVPNDWLFMFPSYLYLHLHCVHILQATFILGGGGLIQYSDMPIVSMFLHASILPHLFIITCCCLVQPFSIPVTMGPSIDCSDMSDWGIIPFYCYSIYYCFKKATSRRAGGRAGRRQGKEEGEVMPIV